MEYWLALQQNPVLFLSFVAILSLMVGSFLNVVAWRLPRMMEQEWNEQCREHLGLDADAQASEPKLGLATPRSHCPSCHTPISAWDNIPLISYALLRGQCRHCGAHISIRYPIIEFVTALLSVLTAWMLGPEPYTLALVGVTWALVALTVIDFEHQLLPDIITLPLLWLGIIAALFSLGPSLNDAVLGAVFGYMAPWSLYRLHKALTGKEGMGYGDFKLLAMLGAWVGWQGLFPILLLSSLVGAVVGLTLIAVRGRDRNIPIPFGPYLAGAGWIYFLWGQDIINAYWRWAGL